ncbi:unnamed protein product [Rotaria socialis]
MRKIHCCRFSILFRILLISFIILTTFTFIKQEIFKPNNCHGLEQDSSVPSSSIPSRYLLIPYREFAYRTSISCNAYKFDEPNKDLSRLHPKYSQYLRGEFPYVIPYTNITYEDVENFYKRKLNKNQREMRQISFASNIQFENIPYKYENGMWSPIGVTSAQRTVILVPLQGRDYNAKAFLLNMHAFARRQLLTYLIVIIEQVYPINSRFNKGRLYNAGIRYIQENQEKLNITCFILHDVDLIPENDGNFYSCDSKHPKHTTLRIRKLNSTRGYSRFYEFLIGGALVLTFDMYRRVNGFSNLFWGWGGEDDDLALRFIQRRMCVVRPSSDLAHYIALPHPGGQSNNARFKLLTWSTVRLDTDGYNQIGSMTRIVHIISTSTVLHLKIDVDANHLYYKSASIGNSQLIYKKTYADLTTTRELVTRSVAKKSTSM